MPILLLDNPALFKKHDQHHVLESILALPKQCAQAWAEASRLKLPAAYRNPRNIVVCAMGGSALGGHLIKSIFENTLKAPFEVVNHYKLPTYVDKGTLVFAISYSGTTEETVAAAAEAKKRGANVVGITVGRRLGAWLRKTKLPCYIFDQRHNPSCMPRLGTGYTMTSMLAFLTGIKTLNLKSSDFSGLQRGFEQSFGPAVPLRQNPAKQRAAKLQDRGILIFASEHLLGNAHTLANQINESAKQFAVSFSLPEMNHHLLEGLTFPKLNPRYLAAFFLESRLYHSRVHTRYPITKAVLKKQRIPAYGWAPKGDTRFAQALETLSFGSFLSFYLAMLNRIDPARIPWVDYFKRKLAQ